MISVLGYLFTGGANLTCVSSGDANDDGKIDVSDAITLLRHLFGNAGSLPEPFGACGEDPTPDGLSCGGFSPCG